MKEKILTGVALLSSFVFFISMFFLTIQSLGIDSTNKATILSGVLSMIGGLVGAFSAYLIARMQITKQLDLQDEKDRNRILLEIRVRKAEELLDVLNRTRMSYWKLQGSWTSIIIDYFSYINANRNNTIDYDGLKNERLVDILSENRDLFVHTYSECYKYKPHFVELVEKIQNVHEQKFRDLTNDINTVMLRFGGVDYKRFSWKDLLASVEKEIDDVDSTFEVVLDSIDNQIKEVENQVSLILLDFKN